MGSDGNSAVKIEGGRGSAVLSLHCKDREFPSNFDVVPKKICKGIGGTPGKIQKKGGDSDGKI